MAKNKTKIIVITAVILAAVLAVTLIVFPFLNKSDEERYNDAKAALSAGEYSEAYNLFREIKGYSDADTYLKKFKVIFDKEISNNGKTTKTVTNTYDENGRLIETVTETGSSVVKLKYEYDLNDNLTGVIKVIDGTEQKVEEYFYDEDSYLIKEMRYDNGSLFYVSEYFYKDGNRVKSVNSLNISGFINNNTVEYYYDGNKLIKDIYTDERQQITTEYDNGLIKKVTNYNYINGTTSYTDYSYDSTGNLLSATYTGTGETIIEEENTYDDNGNLLTKKLRDAYGVWYEAENNYDDNNKLIRSYISQRTKSDINSTFTTEEEHFDKNGNLIKKTSSSDGESEEAVYVYDNRNNPVSITKTYKYSEDSVSVSTSTNVYDKMNNLIKTEETVKTTSSTDPSDIIYSASTTYTYTHDSFGNVLTDKQVSLNTLTGSKSEKSESYEYYGVRVIYDAESEE